MQHVPAAPPATRAASLTPLFVAAIFVGSFLLFALEPMFARLLLPRLGGAPAVWNSALLFYQAALFAGYLWAHLLSRFPLRAQLVAHGALLAGAAALLPIAVGRVPDGWQATSPALWLPALFALSIGPVFVAVAAQAPLLQSWFARSGLAPWFLYAASNAGSFGALLLYPLAAEPGLPLTQQRALWSWGYAALAALTLACGWVALRQPPAPVEQASGTAERPTLRRRLRWAAWAAVPSGLLISTTSWLTTDVMSVPLFWVVPLALYLVTFIVAFGGAAGALSPERVAPISLLMLGSYVFLVTGGVATIVAAAGLVLFFYVALALHKQLADDAPAPERATEFYLWIAGGGVVGGLLPALAAPLMFDWTYEHPILLALSAALIRSRPLVPAIGRLWRGRMGRALRWASPVVAAALVWYAGSRITGPASLGPLWAAVAVLAALAVVAIGRPGRFAFHFACLMAALGGIHSLRISANAGQRERSFFGVYTVQDDTAQGVRELLHGTTLHGAQSLLPGYRRRPTTYYHPGSGLGRVLTAAPLLFPRPARIGVVGLGTGTTACWAQPGQSWTFYEIDPVVVRIARDPKRFSYLSECAPAARMVLGDARLSLAAAPAGGLDVLAVDAFSSDAIPVHLLTREAFGVYRRALAPDGLLLVHISNRFVGLEPVVASIAARDGWTAWTSEKRKSPAAYGLDDTGADWVLMTRSPARAQVALGAMPPGEWRKVSAPDRFRPWSDDFASILPLIK